MFIQSELDEFGSKKKSKYDDPDFATAEILFRKTPKEIHDGNYYENDIFPGNSDVKKRIFLSGGYLLNIIIDVIN